MFVLKWDQSLALPSKGYICGYCGFPLASEKGWRATIIASGTETPRAFIYICHQCTKPTFFDENGKQTPDRIFGNTVNDIPDQSISDIYNEARKSTSVGSYTAAVLCCRKLLMHIAVSKGAKVNQNFIYYVEYLADNHYVPPDAREWVDHIRKKGNEANHEILIMKPEDALDLISFSEMLLKVIFEFPAAVKRKTNP